MRDGNAKRNKISWPKNLVKKWFNIKSKGEDFHVDDDIIINGGNAGPRRPNKIDLHTSHITDVHNYRIFVATWNVAGKSPPSFLNLDEWLHTSPPADIYVLGFQEIVPLNAGSVLGTEDNGPARKWLAILEKSLSNLPGCNGASHTPSQVPCPVVELDDDFESSNREREFTFFHRGSFQPFSRSMRVMDSDISLPQLRFDRRYSVCDRVIYGHRASDYCDPTARWDGSSDDENELGDSHCCYSPLYKGSESMEAREGNSGHSRYCLLTSKQMVGIFLTIWIKTDLRDAVCNLKVSCVGRGLMGYLGNKGSISISMSLHQTSFCFVCSHLTSGEKYGDEQRRNSDVMEILKKTRFSKIQGSGNDNSPHTIRDHDRIIWLGDLNYRIALSYPYAKALVEMQNWRALLENDQLQIEQSEGRVFAGWSEGKIYFPPTYKYSNNSDRYAGENFMRPKEKRRTPAWCDRILWHGRGLQQVSYVRGESRFSDHRPVYSVFLAEVESINRGWIKKSSSSSSARVEVEELLPYIRTSVEYL